MLNFFYTKSPDGSTLSTYRGDSGYISRRTSSPTPTPPSPTSQKRAVDPSPLEAATKRPRSESFGSMNDHSWSTMMHSRKLDTAGEEIRHSNDEGMDKAVYMHRLDTLMAKVQKLRESTLMAREEREREKSPFREGSPLAPRENDPQYLPSVRIATATATHFQELNRPDWGMPPRRVLPDTVSLEMVKSTDPSLRRDRPIATVEEASRFDGSFHSTAPQSNLVHPEQQMSTENASPKVPSVDTVHEVSSSGWPLHLSATSGQEFPASQSHSPENNHSFAIENVTSLGEEINYRQNRITCDVCKKNVKNNSELKKHQLRHAKPYICQVPGCPRVEGFSTKSDLDRHAQHKHPELSAKVERYRCRFPGCKSADKSWPRLDNFRSHLQRVHSRHLTEAGIEGLVRGAQFDCAVADILESNGDKPQAPPLVTHRSEDQLDLQSLHVLADSAVFERYYSLWPHGKEQKV
ncbi:hypothetical protein B0O99DRAFT_600727 [Bisporella sp. PMI_857]|nr:hypothetical protein B0O99DRAFT_600727 [Bisporella sp. PMI_857]